MDGLVKELNRLAVQSAILLQRGQCLGLLILGLVQLCLDALLLGLTSLQVSDLLGIAGSTFGLGRTAVTCTATDASGNSATAGFDVVVEYGGGDGINAKKLRSNAGSSNPLSWAWQDAFGNNIDSSNDVQLLSIIDCDNPSMVVLDVAGDPGASGFRVKNGFVWEFNWQSDWNGFNGNFGPLPAGDYCARVESAAPKPATGRA